MNYILVEQDERLQLLISIVKRLKNCTVVVFSDIQIDFLSELFALMGIKANFRTQQQPQNNGLQIYYDPPQEEVKNGLLFVMPEEQIPSCPENKLQKNKQEQFVNDEVQKLISRNYNLNCLAEKAYKDFVYNYQHKLDKSKYDVLKLYPMRLCKSFGFEVTPRLNNFRLKPSSEYVNNKESNKHKAQQIKKQIKKKTNNKIISKTQKVSLKKQKK